MALKKPLVMNGGQIQQLQAGDSLDATALEVDVVAASNNNASPIVIGSPVYVAADGAVDLARANAGGTSRVFGLVKDASIAAAASGSIQVNAVLTATTGEWDIVTGQTGGLTPNAVYYLSAATAGKLTTTAPSSGYVVEVGLALSSVALQLNIQAPIQL